LPFVTIFFSVTSYSHIQQFSTFHRHKQQYLEEKFTARLILDCRRHLGAICQFLVLCGVPQFSRCKGMTMTPCFFVSDLHGHENRYDKLFAAIKQERPACVFMGGDLFPTGLRQLTRPVSGGDEFLENVLIGGFQSLRDTLGDHYPRVFLILGNDDSRLLEADIVDAGETGLWEYMHNRSAAIGSNTVYGYACVPPTPFLMKDWERYDVSRYVDPGCVSPEEGRRSVHVPVSEIRYGTIKEDLDTLCGDDEMQNAVMLFHTPPYDTMLDRAGLDGKMVDHVPMDVHVGSIAVRRFIEARQPRITLHGHIHESARITNHWRDKIGDTHMFSAAHDGKELALVSFDLERPDEAARRLV
jgi:uncharacterized protein